MGAAPRGLNLTNLRWESIDDIRAMTSLIINQVGYRFYADDGVMGSATALAAQNTAPSLVIGSTFRVRIEFEETGGAGTTNEYTLQFDRNSSGSWFDVTTASANVRGVASAHVAQDTATTGLLTAGGGTFRTGRFANNGGAGTTDTTLSGGDHSEWEYMVELRADGNWVAGDTVRFRVVRNGNLLSSYTVLATGTAVAPPVVLDQIAYQGRNDDGNLGLATSKAAQNTPFEVQPDETFRVRFEVQESGGGSTAPDLQLQYRHVPADAQILRPVADSSPSGWTPTPLWAELDDNSEADFIESTSTSAFGNVMMSTTGTDPGAVPHIFRIRARRTGASGTIQLNLYQGTGGTNWIGDSPTWDLTTDWQTFEWVLSSAQEDAITDYGALQVRHITSAVGVQVAWSEVQLGGTAWGNVTGGGAVQAAASVHVGNGTTITSNLLTAGTGTFTSGEFSSDSLAAAIATMAANGHTEVEYGVTASSAGGAAASDLIEFRVVHSAGALLDAYTATPQVTVATADINVTIGKATETSTARVVTVVQPIVVAVGRVIETSTARAIAGAKQRTIGKATETSTARAVTGFRSLTVGRVVETSTARAVAASKERTFGKAAETDLARAVDTSRSLALGRPVETDTARPVGWAKAAVLGRPVETDTARAIAPSKQAILGRAVETDTARLIEPPTPMIRVDVGLAAEADTARPVSGSKQRTFGKAAETDAARPVEGSRSLEVGRATETDAARAVGRERSIDVGRTTETDTARAFVIPKFINLGVATETSTARPVAGSKARTFGKATEADLARPVGRARSVDLGRAVETDAALRLFIPINKLVAPARETDSARPVAGSKARIVGRAVEADQARGWTFSYGQTIGRVVEVDLARPMGGAKERTFGRALELDTARPVTTVEPPTNIDVGGGTGDLAGALGDTTAAGDVVGAGAGAEGRGGTEGGIDVV